MKKAVMYLRVSTPSQGNTDRDPEGLSIPAQRDACVRKAESLDAEIVEEFKDQGESAKSADREELQRMMKFLRENNDIDYMIVHKLDRFIRHRDDDVFLGIELRKLGVKFVSCSENIDETPSGKLMHGMLASFAEYYSNNLALEVRKGMDQKAKVGGTPTRAPLGYLNVPEVIGQRVIHSVAVDEERAPLMREAFELYATGNYSVVQLCDYLNEKGLRSRAGKVAISRPIAWGTLTKLLKKPYYTGDVVYKGVQYEGRHTALISKEVFERVQQVLKSHMSGEKQRVHMHYLKSSVHCMRCGAPLRITAAKSIYLYYFCSSRAKRKLCDLPYLEASLIEESVMEHYRSVQLSDQEVELVRTQVTDYMQKRQATAESDAKRQSTRLIKLKDERTKLMQAYYANAIPLDVLTNEQTRINRDIQEAESVLAKSSTKFEELSEVFEQVVWLLRNCYDAYQQAPDRVRRMMNQALFTQVYVDQEFDSGKTNTKAVALTEPFGALMSLTNRPKQPLEKLKLAQSKTRPGGLVLRNQSLFLDVDGSKHNTMVGNEGLEPPTFRM